MEEMALQSQKKQSKISAFRKCMDGEPGMIVGCISGDELLADPSPLRKKLSMCFCPGGRGLVPHCWDERGSAHTLEDACSILPDPIKDSESLAVLSTVEHSAY